MNPVPVVVVGGLLLAWLMGDDDGGGGGDTPLFIPPPVFPKMPSEPDQPQQPQTPALVYASLLADEPTPGKLYQIRQGDNLGTVAQRALGVPPGDPMVAPYIRRMTSASRWNWMLYATGTRRLGNGKWPYFSARYNSDGNLSEARGDLRAAFFPGNDAVFNAVAQQQLPHRTYRWTTNPNNSAPISDGGPRHGSAYGVLWLPEVGGVDNGDAPQNNPTPLLVALGKSLDNVNPGM